MAWRGVALLDAIHPDRNTRPTHTYKHKQQVKQSVVYVPMESQFAFLYDVLRRAMAADPDYKVLCSVLARLIWLVVIG